MTTGKKKGTAGESNANFAMKQPGSTTEGVKNSKPEDDKGMQIFTYENAKWFLIFALGIQLFMAIENKIGLGASLITWHILSVCWFGMCVYGMVNNENEIEINWSSYFYPLEGVVHVFLFTMIHRDIGEENFVAVQQDCFYAAIGEFILCVKTVGLIFYQIYVYFTGDFSKVFHTSHNPVTGEKVDHRLTPKTLFRGIIMNIIFGMAYGYVAQKFYFLAQN